MKYWKIILILVFVLIAAVFIYPHLKASFKEIPKALQEAKKNLLFLLVIFQVIAYIGDGWLSKQIVAIGGYKVSIKDAIKIAILGNLGNQTMPVVGGATATFFFYKSLRIPGKTIFFLIFAWTLLVWLAYVLFFMLSLFFIPLNHFNLIANHDFSGLLAIVSILLLGLFLLTRKKAKNLLRGAKIFDRIFFRLFKKRKNFASKVGKFIKSFRISIKLLMKEKWKLMKMILASLIFYGGMVATFYVCFLVFGFRPNIFYVIFGYNIAAILALLSLAPEAPGVMEVSLSGVFIALGFPAHIALFAAVLFRFFSYWVSLPIGIYLFSTFKKKANQLQQ